MICKTSFWLGGLVLGLALSSGGCAHRADGTSQEPSFPIEGKTTHAADKVEVVSKLYEIDRIYKSMTGPWSLKEVRMAEGTPSELVWITGAHVRMVDGEAANSMPELFMCHANLDMVVDKHRSIFDFKGFRDGRLFTLSQGQLEVTFPEGFGIPVMSDEALQLVTQVLHLNFKDQKFQVRHQVTFDCVRDRDLKQPMKPLYQSGVFGLKSLEGEQVAYDVGDESLAREKCSSCCLPGKKAVDWSEGMDRYGRRFTGHWIVKPGREENRTRATTMLALNADTKIHYIAVHMHPFAESLELRDVTTDETIFKSQVRNFEDKIGFAHVDSFSGSEGIPVYRTHEYELVSEYNNTSGEDQDSMAVMYVYLMDPEFKHPGEAQTATVADAN